MSKCSLMQRKKRGRSTEGQAMIVNLSQGAKRKLKSRLKMFAEI